MEKRANILALATKVSLESMTYTGITYKDPEYRILAPIVDDDMCAVMMHMRLEWSHKTWRFRFGSTIGAFLLKKKNNMWYIVVHGA